MPASDLQLAKSLLAEGGTQFALVKQGRLLARSGGAGLRPIIQALDDLGEEAYGAFLADRIVGRAVAVLACHARLYAVHGTCLSQAARKTLEQANITVSWDLLVPAILNRDHTALCPMEQLIHAIDDVTEAVAALRAALGITPPMQK